MNTTSHSGEAGATHPDLMLARRAAKADPRAWDEIVSRYGERLYGVARRFAGHEGEAEELTQDIFLKIYANLAAYRGDVPLIAWALRLSRNLCIDHYRHHRRRYQSETVSAETALRFHASDDDPHRHSWLRQRREMVHETLATMREDQATAILLRDLQGLSYEEIAHMLEISVGTLKSRLNRARRELMSRMTERLGRVESAAEPAEPGSRWGGSS
ncbi:MAG: sigma-70 family RNA polymerase sigma factor [Acidobacteriota bacterium]